jgi:hypothetical protein
MHFSTPRSRTSPVSCGVWPKMATLPEQCRAGIGGNEAHRSPPQRCSCSGQLGS